MIKLRRNKSGKNGEMEWADKNNLLHQENDEPAVIRDDGSKFWYCHGKLHRENDEPAVIRNTDQHTPWVTKEWWVDGKRHRLSGPAIIRYCDNDEKIKKEREFEWYVNGNSVKKEEFAAEVIRFFFRGEGDKIANSIEQLFKEYDKNN